MIRTAENLLKAHFAESNKMAFLVGPRQVGKTTAARNALPGALYLNWDNQDDRKILLKGPAYVFKSAGGETLKNERSPLILDEIHKYARWKTFLKGLFDTYGSKLSICVTGSARLDVFKRGGDSLMGRYFLYRMHPISLREIFSPELAVEEINKPIKLSEKDIKDLLTFGGYPEPFLKKDLRFSNKWQRLRREQLFKEEIRDLTKISDLGRIQILAERLSEISAGLVNYSNLANDLQVSVDTIRRWFDVLEHLFYCFRIRPFTSNIARSLLREPKVYLWDWSIVEDIGARNENFVALHLLKLVHHLTDSGFGDFGLNYIRDKSKREVDFIVLKNKQPWFLVEVKTGDTSLTDSLVYFHQRTKAKHSFLASASLPHVLADCFKDHDPIVVPMSTLLSQFV